MSAADAIANAFMQRWPSKPVDSQFDNGFAQGKAYHFKRVQTLMANNQSQATMISQMKGIIFYQATEMNKLRDRLAAVKIS